MAISPIRTHLLDALEAEASNSGVTVTPTFRRRIERLLDAMDREQVSRRPNGDDENVESVNRALSSSEGTSEVCDPMVWLGAAECA